MTSTSTSLLHRLRRADDHQAWSHFVQLYTPLLYYWAGRLGLQEQDRAELVQDLLGALVEKLPEFTYEPGKSFRGWLRTVLLNRWRNLRRRRAPLPLAEEADLAEPGGPDLLEIFAEEEYRKRLVQRALELMSTDFQESTRKAFWACEVEGRPAAEVGAELGLSTAAVYVAKSRVLARLREELADFLD
jgi:RNA polymerase sigma-70 factor (ECF subfamily)